MNIVFFSHPRFLQFQSIHRFTRMLADGMIARGHKVEVWSTKPQFFNLPFPLSFKKWLGYIDQYILFPPQIRSQIRKCSADTLFVFADHALGPWVPLVADRPHVIHCHDFLAQRSALGQIPENRTGWSGRRYQAFIRDGFQKGKNFISVSKKTFDDLHTFLPSEPSCSEVVYNGLNRQFVPHDALRARHVLGDKLQLNLSEGYALHVGGNSWYKNRSGVIEIYNAWRSNAKIKVPLLLIGEPPSAGLMKTYSQSSFKSDIYLLNHVEDDLVTLAYAGASIFIFPSLAEGFGWPIVEAMASGCPVVTTNEAPMTEVAGNAGFLVSRRPYEENCVAGWAAEVSRVIDQVIELTPEKRQKVVEAGLENAKRFDTRLAIDRIESIYQNIVDTSVAQSRHALTY